MTSLKNLKSNLTEVKMDVLSTSQMTQLKGGCGYGGGSHKGSHKHSNKGSHKHSGNNYGGGCGCGSSYSHG